MGFNSAFNGLKFSYTEMGVYVTLFVNM